MKEFTCTIQIRPITFNNMEAKDEEHYKQLIKEQFYQDFNLELSDDEITDIQVLEES